MPLRRLGHFSSWKPGTTDTAQHVDCGSEAMVSGGIADPLGEGQQQPQGVPDAGQQPGGQQQKQQQKQPQRFGQIRGARSRPSQQRLEQAAGEVFVALHGAKQDLANEMEANLKQLKAILQDTQRIAKEMEAIMKEAKAEPTPRALTRGTGQTNWQPPAGGRQQAEQKQDEGPPPTWQPPDAAQQNQQHAP